MSLAYTNYTPRRSREDAELDRLRDLPGGVHAWTAANDAVDEAALAVEIEDGLVMSNRQRQLMLGAVLRAIGRAT